MLYDSNYMTFWKRQNSGDSKSISGCQGLVRGKKGMNKQSTEYFQGSENTLNDIIMIDMCHYTLSKPIESRTPRVNPMVKYGLWMIMMYQCRFINCNKCITLMGDVDNGRGCVCTRAGSTWEINGCIIISILL